MNTVLNISEAASIAVHCLALVASKTERISIQKIAQLTNFSKNHIAKVFQLLTKKGYLSSDRGPSGGYILKKEASQITLLEIYELIDGTIETSHCNVHDETCPFTECVFGNIREKMGDELKSYLSMRTIKDIVKIK